MRRLVLSLLVALVGCGVPVEEQEQLSSSATVREFSPQCGVIADGERKSTVSADEATEVQITGVTGGNQVVVLMPEGETVLIKLHGIGEASGPRAQQAINTLSSLATGTQSLFRAGATCDVATPTGSRGLVGQLFTKEGMSLSEAMAQSGLVEATIDEPCASAEYSNCLAQLGEKAQVTAGELTAFLWKPESDSDGHLAIHTGPYGTEVIVNGERGRNQGPGNGYGSLARFSKGGCAYAAPRIQVVNSYSGLPYTVGGKSTFTLSSPCERHCLQGGEIVRCSK